MKIISNSNSDISYHNLFDKLSSVLAKYASKEELSNSSKVSLVYEPEFQNFLKFSPGITAIIDFKKEGYVFMSDNVEELWGYKAEEFLKLGLVKTITIFPVSQNEIIINKIFPLMFKTFDEYAAKGEIFDIRISYNTKTVRADGTEGWYLHQMKVLHIDEFNKPQFGFKLISDISDFKKDEAIDFVVSKKSTDGIYKKVFAQTFISDKKTFPISEREIEVLSLIGSGKSSKEIADILFISEHTVNNHRKNMIKKVDVNTTGELLKKAIAHGVI